MTNIKLGDWDLDKKQIEDWVTCGLRNESKESKIEKGGQNLIQNKTCCRLLKMP